MSFHLWSGIDSDFKHEADQINHLKSQLKKWSESSNINIHLMTNFYVAGEEIDCAIILPHNIIVIDLKTGKGSVVGSENGEWTCESEKNKFTLNPGRKNPYLQAREKKYGLMNYLKSRIDEIFSPQKASQMSFNHTNSYIVFSDKVDWDSTQVDPKIKVWFDVIDIASIPSKLDTILSKKIKEYDDSGNPIYKSLNLSDQEAWLIPTLLNLKSCDSGSKRDFRDGSEKNVSHNNQNQAETTSSKELLKYKEDDKLNQNKNLLSVIFTGLDGNSILAKNEDGSEYVIRINKKFENIVNDLSSLMSKNMMLINKDEIKINLINFHLSKENNIYNVDMSDELESLIVIEPEWLINVTSLTQFDWCARSLFNNRFSISKTNEAMTRGIIVHEVFEDIMRSPEDKEGLKEKLQESFDKRAFDFTVTQTDPDEIEKIFVRPHLRELYKYRLSRDDIKKVETEKFIINPILGLKGKIDAVVTTSSDEIQAIELKTGKSYGGKAKSGHQFQVQAYSLLMEMKVGMNILNPKVIYSGDYQTPYFKGIERDVLFGYNEKSNIVNLRNKLVIADYLFFLEYEKMNKNKCSKCVEKIICKSLYNLEIEHNKNNIPFFSNEAFSDLSTKDEKLFFSKYNRLLTEEYRVIKENQGRYLAKSNMERVSDRKCVPIDNWSFNKRNVYILNCVNQSEIREMDRCLVSSEKGPVAGECLEAVVTNVMAGNITIKTRAKIEFTPRYLDVTDSESSFEKNYSMIYELINNKDLKNLKDMLINETYTPKDNVGHRIDSISGVEERQMKAIELSLGSSDFLLIQGPPGTGKTSTLSNIVDQYHKSGKKIIISCFTHRAINEVIKKLRKVSPDLPIYKLGTTNIKSEGEDILLESKINTGNNLREKMRIAEDIISKEPIYIGTTHAWLSGRYDKLFIKEKYDVGIIDEASQVLLPNALGVLRLVKKFILIGDHMQLPAVVQSDEAEELKETLFEDLFNKVGDESGLKIMLDVQFRMPQVISDFISNEFYDGKLKTSEIVSENKLDIHVEDSPYSSIYNPDYSMALVDISTSDDGFFVRKVSPPEASVVVGILRDLIKGGVSIEKIGIIAPFRAQVAEIRRQIETELFEEIDSVQIKSLVDTVDRFQGDERDVIIFSLTISDENIPRILRDERRINVALSRSKKKFIGVGRWSKIDECDTLRHLKEYVINSDNCILINT